MNLPGRIVACMGIGVTAALVALLLSGSPWINRLEFVTWDMRQRLLATPAPPDVPIKLILIDQPSLDWANEQAGSPWPWPREFYTAIIDFCEAGGAKAIAFDLFFSEPSMFGQEDDNRFASSLSGSEVAVLAVPPGAGGGAPVAWPEDVPRPGMDVAGWSAWRALHPEADVALDSIVMSLPEIASSAAALGHVRGEQDADSIIRRMTPIVTFDGAILPVLGLAMEDVSQPAAEYRIEDGALHVGAHAVPLGADGTSILRFREPTQRGAQRRMYEAFSAAGIINAHLAIISGETPAVAPDVLEDCYVLIGPSAIGTYDIKPTPMNKAGPGVEVHATFLDNLLHDDFISRPGAAWVWLLTIGLALVGAFATRESRNTVQVVLAFVFTLPLPWLVGFAAFEAGSWWPIVVPEFGLSMALVGGLIANYATEGRQRRFIKRTFQYYLSPTVIEQIVRDPSRLRLGGERRELSILFSDISGFSGIAEQLDAEVLATVLNDYLTAMTTIILEEEGTLDKYIGDAIVAFWNAPLDQADHARRAARAAARCQQALDDRRDAYRRTLGAALHMRIGVNTGVASVGNFGSHGRFDYTIIGHAVNLASRLEGANKFFGTSTLVSHDAWQQVKSERRGREIGLVRVAGVNQPTRIYELLPGHVETEQSALEAFHEALALCQAGRHTVALKAFERLIDDPIARLYVARLRSLSRDGQSEWDGVWDLTEK